MVDESGDANTGTVTATTQIGGRVDAMAVDPSTHSVYLANDATPDSVWVVDESGDATSGTVRHMIPVAGYPTAMAFDPSTHDLYVASDEFTPATDTASSVLFVIDETGDAHSEQVTATTALSAQANSWTMAVDPSTHKLFVATSGKVAVIDANTYQVTSWVQLDQGSPPNEATVDPSTHDLYIADGDANVSVVDESEDANNGTILGTIATGGSWGLAVDPVTHHFYDGADGVLVIIPSARINGLVSDGSSGAGIAGACVKVITPSSDRYVALLHADSAGVYTGTFLPGSYKLLVSDCVGGTHATTYYGGADNYDFDGPSATLVTVTSGSVTSDLNVALPLAGIISGTVTDSVSGLEIAGICAYAVDSTESILRGYSAPSTSNGSYTIAGLPPGTDRVAFESCTTGGVRLGTVPTVCCERHRE